ncbi:MAG: Stp1/IreP family PP2C-type Ser/Thr phosphatase [Acidimicrobiales bacterium]
MLRSGGATDVGLVRSNNQDQFLVTDVLCSVADGMGGHAAGEVASLTAIEALRVAFEADVTADGLAQAVRNANRAVWDRAQEQRDLRGMGTTITAVALVTENDDDVLAVVNVGDSRAYLLRDGNLDQLTEDHSVPEELRRAGRLSPSEAATHPQRNVLTRALGVDPEVEVDCFMVTPYQGDRLALASDGLFNEVDHTEIARVLRTEPDPVKAAQELVRLAREGGGNDNITVVVVDVADDDGRSHRASSTLTATPAAPADAATPPARFRPAPPPPATSPPSPARKATPQNPPRRSGPRVTLRAVFFLFALLAVLGGALGAIGWFARAGYFVGEEDGEVVIFKGRPDGLLWFEPTVADRTGVLLDEVRASRRPDIESGREASSLADARRFVDNNLAPTTTTIPVTTDSTVTTVTTVTAPAVAPPVSSGQPTAAAP